MQFKTIIITHGKAGKALLESAEMIVGKTKDTYALSLDVGKSPEKLREELMVYIDENKVPIVFLVDLIGGTPCNVALSIAKQRDAITYCVAGINLAMLIELNLVNENTFNTIDELVDRIVGTGMQSCKWMNKEGGN